MLDALLGQINMKVEENRLEEAAKKVYLEAEEILRANRRPATALKTETAIEVHLWCEQVIFVLSSHKYVAIGMEYDMGCGESGYLTDTFVSVEDALKIGLLPHEITQRVLATQVALVKATDAREAEVTLIKAARAVGHSRAMELLGEEPE